MTAKHTQPGNHSLLFNLFLSHPLKHLHGPLCLLFIGETLFLDPEPLLLPPLLTIVMSRLGLRLCTSCQFIMNGNLSYNYDSLGATETLSERFPSLANEDQKLMLVDSNDFDANPLGFSH